MRLICDDIVRLGHLHSTLFCEYYGIPSDALFEVEVWRDRLPVSALPHYSAALDFSVAAHLAQRSQTFLFDCDQVLAFVRSIDRRLPPGDYPLPFPVTAIQFSRGIDERLFTSGRRATGGAEEYDEILGLLLAAPHAEEHGNILTVAAWYQSTSVNRVQLLLDGDGEIHYAPLDASAFAHLSNVEELRQDKQRLANLALLCLAYLHSPGVEVSRVQADPKVNRKRVAKGKRALPDYYVCQVRKERRAVDVVRTAGRHVSFMFPVRGHFRRLQDGRTVWVTPHFRGVDHGPDSQRPKVYQVP